MVEQFLNVGPRWTLRFGDGASLLQGPGSIVKFFSKRFQVPIALVPVGVGNEGKQLGGAEWPGNAFRFRLRPLGRVGSSTISSAVVHFRFWGGGSAFQVRVFRVGGASTWDDRFSIN